MTWRPRRDQAAPSRPGAAKSAGGMEVPVVLPLAVLTVRDDETVTVTVDGAPYKSSSVDGAWRRESVTAVLDALVNDLRCPLRIELRESDGSTFTDVIVPPSADPAKTESGRVADAPHRRPSSAAPAQGFLGGEEVAIAVVIGHHRARSDGTVPGLPLAAQKAAAAGGEVILLGRVSGAHTVSSAS